MRRYFSLLMLAVCFGLIGSILIVYQAQAQIDAFTYFVPFPTDQLDDLFDLANNDNNYIDDNIETTISISIHRDNTTIYYDHWEDGLEENPTIPTQGTTEVFNGDAGDIFTLSSSVELPRNLAELFYDGGDKIVSVNGSIAISLAVWPESASTLYAGAWGLGSTAGWGTDYLIPVGVDLFGTGPNQRPAWGVVAVNVQAVEDGTMVQLDLDADGTLETTLTLNHGEQFTQIAGDAMSGARIQSSVPVQVHLFTGNPTPGVNYEARAYTMLPENLVANDYLVPRSSDGDHWLHNPHTTPLTVTATTMTGVDTIVIPADSTVNYPSGSLSGATGVRFTSVDGRSFNGLTALDQDSAQDWGYAWAPVEYLSSQVLVGWAPGNNLVMTGDPAGCTLLDPTNPLGDESRVYVTAITTTTVNVDYDIDGVIDDTFDITPFSEVGIIDPTDCDMTGAFLYSEDPDRPFAAVWGQDESAPGPQPSIDVGTGLIGLASLSVQKSIEIINDADGSGDLTPGDTVRYQIFTENNAAFPVDPAVILDTLPPTVSYWANTSTVRDTSIADDNSPPAATIFPFDEGGYSILGGLAPREVLTATYDALVNDDVEEICNEANIDSPVVPRPPSASICVPVAPPIQVPTPIPTPTPTPTPTPLPTSTPDDPEPTRVPATATPAAVAVVTALPTSTVYPVAFLPETGIRTSQAIATSQVIFFSTILGSVILIFKLELNRRRRK